MDPETRAALLQISRSLADMKRHLTRLETLETPQFTTGTWTPTFVGSTTAGVYTYTNQSGNYAQFGRMVYIAFRVSISAIGTPPVGNMSINGLPFTSEAGFFHGVYFDSLSHFNYTNTAFDMAGRIGPSATKIDLLEFFDSAANVPVPAANFTDVLCDMSGTGIYRLP